MGQRLQVTQSFKMKNTKMERYKVLRKGLTQESSRDQELTQESTLPTDACLARKTLQVL